MAQMRTLLALVVVVGLAHGLLLEFSSADPVWSPVRSLGRRRSPYAFRRRILGPPRGSAGKLYLAPLSLDGSAAGRLPNTIFLKRVSAAQTSPIRLSLAHGMAQLATPSPLAVNRRGGRPTARPWHRQAARRKATTWVYPSAETPLAPPGHWEGSDPGFSFESFSEPSNRQAGPAKRPVHQPAATANSRQRAAPTDRTVRPSDPGFSFEPFSERSDRLAGPAKRPVHQPTANSRQTAAPKSRQATASSGHTLYTPNERQFTTRNTRKPAARSDRKPAARKNKQSATPNIRQRNRQSDSAGHTSVNVRASVVYPGSAGTGDVTPGSVRTSDVIFDARVDPQQSASRMSPGEGFRLPPLSVEYGGWQPIVV